VNDFNAKVRNVVSVTGESGIEVLPTVPVVFERTGQGGEGVDWRLERMD
jgi:hypothetical protein